MNTHRIRFYVGFESVGQPARIVFSEAGRGVYLDGFQTSVPDAPQRIEYAEKRIEIVATRSQRLLQFNSILIAALAL
jgi:hypothetical protein